MPELPEVETVCRGLTPLLRGQVIKGCSVRQPQLRWPVPEGLEALVQGRRVVGLERRGKYLIIELDDDQAFMMHLGMSGSLSVFDRSEPLRKHDHVIFDLGRSKQLRFHDPRRFGSLVWLGVKPFAHPLLDHLGPEPLSQSFDGDYLRTVAGSRKAPVKNFIMDASIVVGVGNIYASEALFMAKIHPQRQAGKISLKRYCDLAQAIKRVLSDAIRQGGTTLKDFANASGNPGYFQQVLSVYGRQGEPCKVCKQPIRMIRLGQRSTFYCSSCQR